VCLLPGESGLGQRNEYLNLKAFQVLLMGISLYLLYGEVDVYLSIDLDGSFWDM
jgi:hypothetical protein